MLGLLKSVFGISPKKELADCPVVVVVGGGYGGLNVAKALDKSAKFNVVLIDRKDHHLHNMASARACVVPSYEEEVTIPYNNLLKYGSVVQGEVTEVKEDCIFIHGKDEPLKFDYLIIATGTSYAFPGKLAMPTRESAMEKYKECQDEIKKANKIAVIGGGPVGVELAGEIKETLPEKEVTLIHSGEHLCQAPGLLEAFSDKVEHAMEKVGVKLVLGERTMLEESKADQLEIAKQKAIAVEDFDEAKRVKEELAALKDSQEKTMINLKKDLPVNYAVGARTLQTNKGTAIETDLVFFCMGAEVNNASLTAFENKMERGRLKTDDYLRVEGYENIFAIGDIANTEAQMGFYAMNQAKYLSGYFIASISGKSKAKPYKLGPTASIVSAGKNGGAAQLPIGKGKVFGSFVAKNIKSKDMFTRNEWKNLNQDRKSKVLKEGENADEQLTNLAAALSITEEEALAFKEEALPEVEEREGFKS